MNYDPVLTCSGNYAKQTVRLVFGLWEYRHTTEVEVKGNVRGLDVIDYAVERFYESLLPEADADEYTFPALDMSDESFNVLHCADEDDQGADWLKDMLVSAEIVKIEPHKRQER
ncbi:DUF5406 family protein [Sinimarinibacterium sp. NLF-5-8]|uniref:DUF5406 family protein n=1 Tax=Sinimarinibacterium sp. NLF-5-8 TaxID=2698684 RepID=UPI00192F1075|nr:DUF5406 family protein [Sinimarinibacterium sp. NLF-5-8]